MTATNPSLPNSGSGSGIRARSSVDVASSQSEVRQSHISGAGRTAAHLVQFYEDDHFLCETVADYVGLGLGTGEPVIIIATAAHRREIAERLTESSFDVERAQRSGQLTLLDAHETLASFMRDDAPDWELFKTHVGSLVRKRRAERQERPVRAYGEMVDVLWKAGKRQAAMHLEQMWNDLAASERFSLMCGYGMQGFESAQDFADFQQVCACHSHVVPTESFARLESDDSRQRAVGVLQQRARALEAELEHRKELEAQLAEASQAKDEFLAVVSHELRTPLNAILGWVHMLRENAVPPERQARALETIERNARAQNQLIEDLLDVSRIVSGKLRLDVGAVELQLVIERAIETVRPAAAAKGISIRPTLDPSASTVMGDPDRLQQVVWNLLSNAVKFSQKDSEVYVVLRRHESNVELTVRDEGPGIDPQFLPHVFERFRQADPRLARVKGGLGLGLAIVRHLVELHGGNVRADSEGLGRGAVFTVCLPISPLRRPSFIQAPALHLTNALGPPVPCPPEVAGLDVLVVDDEQDARELLSALLTRYGMQVTSAASVEEAMRLLQQNRPDMVISDIGMPEEDGYELIRRLRRLTPEAGGRTPAVALTAYARTEERTKALVSGFNMHLPKPVEPAELLAVLASLAAGFERAKA